VRRSEEEWEVREVKSEGSEGGQTRGGFKKSPSLNELFYFSEQLFSRFVQSIVIFAWHSIPIIVFH